MPPTARFCFSDLDISQMVLVKNKRSRMILGLIYKADPNRDQLCKNKSE